MTKFADAIQADWDPHTQLHDPLKDPAIAPHAPIPRFDRAGKSIGSTLGSLGGGLAGALLPSALGFVAGAGGAYGLEHLLGSDSGFGSSALQIGAGALGAGAAAPAGFFGQHIGRGLGALHGGQIGEGAGKQLEKLYSPERQAAERMRRMNPQHGLALIRTMESTGAGSPSEIEAMKDSYNIRRTGLRHQVQTGVGT